MVFYLFGPLNLVYWTSSVEVDTFKKNCFARSENLKKLLIIKVCLDFFAAPSCCLGNLTGTAFLANFCESSRVILNGPFYDYLIAFDYQGLQ